MPEAEPWWRGGVLYHVYVRSFQDSDGDGVGDLAGVRSRLDYLEWLGIDGIWLSPVTVSPDDDWGYDVADYTDVQPALGVLDDLDAVVADAGERAIRVLLDLVPNHTSDRHPWFVEARASPDSPRRDWYVWADPKPDGSPPNNWQSTFGGSAWTFDEATGQYYLHNFLPTQPDLNWWNEEVRNEFDRILRFWFDRGIAGFRIDVAHGIVKDRRLRDNPPDDKWRFNMNRPEVHDVFRRWRAIADAYDPPRVLLGETWVLEPARLAAFFGTGSDELHAAFNFALVLAPFEADALRAVVDATELVVPKGAAAAWTLSNHDVVRFPTRWCEDDDERARCALLFLLALRGLAVVYYGDELALPQTRLAQEDLLDPVGVRGWPDEPGRDGSRTPMHWSAEPGAGFTSRGVRPWLPPGDHARRNVAAQRDDPESMLHLVRDLVALRSRTDDLRSGGYASLDAPEGVWAFTRGERLLAAANLSGSPATLEPVEGRILVATRRARDGEDVSGTLELRPWEAALLEVVLPG
jgi:alpha-glucosidase